MSTSDHGEPARKNPVRNNQDRRAIERALAAAPHGIEVLDHGLSVSTTEVRIDLVGVDSQGRLVLVLFVAGDAEDALFALRVVALVRRHGGQLAEHIGRALEDPGLRARVVLVAGRATRELSELVEPLAAGGVELFETCTVESRRGMRTFLVSPPAMAGAGLARLADTRPEDLGPGALESAAPGRGDAPSGSEPSSVVAELGRRIERIDDRIEGERTATALCWRLNGQELCYVALDGEVPLGYLESGDDGCLLGDTAAAEGFLANVLERYLAFAEGPPAGGGRRAGGVGGALGGAQLLTPEEIEAFREPMPS